MTYSYQWYHKSLFFLNYLNRIIYNHNKQISDFKINKFKGNQCKNKIKNSRLYLIEKEYKAENNFPCWLKEYKNNE